MPYGTVNTDIVADSSGGKLAPISSVFRNRIINGAMVIDQRNAGASISAAGGGRYAVDRWRLDCDNIGTATIQQSSTAPAGFVNSYYFNSTVASSTPSAGNDNSLYQNIEGFNIADLGWGTANAKTVTVSFWVQSSVTGTYGFGLINASVNRSYVGQFTISSANTWTQVSVTVAGDTSGTWGTTNGTGIRLAINMGGGSNQAGTANAWQAGYKYFATGNVSLVNQVCSLYLAGVQLEVGSSATGFEYVNYQTSLANCQRYFVKFLGSAAYEYVPYSTFIAVNSTQAYGNLSFPQQMRALPSISGANLKATIESAGYTISSITGSGASYGGTWQSELYVVGTGFSTSLPFFIQANNSTSAYVYLSAEL
jgi:hypothetical protein